MLNLTHPVLVMGSIAYLLSACAGLTSLLFLSQSLVFFSFLYFLHARRLLYYVFISGVALLLGCFWALQLSTWGGWWVWENSELLLLFLFILLVVLLHSYFIFFECFLVNLLAVFYLTQYVVAWLFVFWWNSSSLHTFSVVSIFFFHHYFALITWLLLTATLTTWRIRTMPYLLCCYFFPPTLLLACWVGLWLSWMPVLGGGFLIVVFYAFMHEGTFRSHVALLGHLLFLVFFVLVVFFNFNLSVPAVIWLLISYLTPLVYFAEAAAIDFCTLIYLQTEPIYPNNINYLSFVDLGFTLYSSCSIFAYLEPTFVLLCVFVICFYG